MYMLILQQFSYVFQKTPNYIKSGYDKLPELELEPKKDKLNITLKK